MVIRNSWDLAGVIDLCVSGEPIEVDDRNLMDLNLSVKGPRIKFPPKPLFKNATAWGDYFCNNLPTHEQKWTGWILERNMKKHAVNKFK